MKTIFTLLLACITSVGYGKSNQAYQKLCEVNKCWTEQTDISNLAYPQNTKLSEREWIRTHLQLVEQTLRTRSTEHLTTAQKANRLAALDQLNRYRHSGAFPINDEYNYRTPIFIDRYDNFCAVGYLVKATGHEDVSRMIAAKTNLAYVREMNYTELFAWANEYGFTVDELAWIQPGYGPVVSAKPVGKGTDGEVHELYVDKTGDKLYVGGVFNTVDSTVNANNIAYLTESGGTYTWHSMGSGVNGVVYAITEYEGKIFIGGNFTASGGNPVNNVAYWDGAKWNATGCIGGTIKDMIVFNNELYAVGDFDVCASMSEVNFAKWNGTMWIGINALDGKVNTIEQVGNNLVLGGDFRYNNFPVNIIKWNSIDGFISYNNGFSNEINDLHLHQDTLFVACRATTDTIGLVSMFNGTDWVPIPSYVQTSHGVMSYNTLFSYGSRLYTGGDFFDTMYISPGSPTKNFGAVAYPMAILPEEFAVDSAVNVIVKFKNTIIAGGKFEWDYANLYRLNSIAKHSKASSVEKIQLANTIINIYPNPTNGSITIENNFNADKITLTDISGKTMLVHDINSPASKINLPSLTPGIYIAELSNAQGEKAVNKIIVE